MRVAAVSALAALRGEAAADVMRPFITEQRSGARDCRGGGARRQRRRRLIGSAPRTRCGGIRRTRASRAPQWRLQVARALGDVRNPSFRPLLVPLMYDANLDVARAAIESAGTLGADDFLFVPPLVSLLRNRRLKSAARAVLVGYGEPVVAPLAYFMRDREEDIWVRRHVPSTLALAAVPLVGGGAARRAR